MDVQVLMLIAFLGFGTLNGLAAPHPLSSVQPSGMRVLDTVSVRKAYMDGDFEEATEQIESALRKGGPFSHEDSVFIYKHLGVMYTAKYETREKGKSYLFKLLQVEPGARIVDMYASDMIYMIFKNICDEYDLYQTKHKHSGRLDSAAAKPRHPVSGSDNAGNASSLKRKPRTFAWLGWTAGALAATGGVALVVALALDDDGRTRNNIVP